MDDQLILEGQYRASYLRYETGNVYGSRRWFVHFKITEPGPFMGVEIVRYYNVPRRPTLARSSNLYLDYVATVGRKPPRGLKPDFLKGCEVLVQVVTVKDRIDGRKRILQPEDCWYSKIDRLIRITAGAPPAPHAGPRVTQ